MRSDQRRTTPGAWINHHVAFIGKDTDELLKQLDGLGAQAINRQDPAYPAELLELADPPTVIYVKGTLGEIQPAVAMVGSAK